MDEEERIGLSEGERAELAGYGRKLGTGIMNALHIKKYPESKTRSQIIYKGTKDIFDTKMHRDIARRLVG